MHICVTPMVSMWGQLLTQAACLLGVRIAGLQDEAVLQSDLLEELARMHFEELEKDSL